MGKPFFLTVAVDITVHPLGPFVLSCLLAVPCALTVRVPVFSAEHPSSPQRESLEQARAYEAGKRYADAVVVLDRLLDSEDPDIRSEARFRSASCLAQLGNDGAAAQRLEPLLSSRRGVWARRACQLSVDIEERLGHPAKAIQALRLLIVHQVEGFDQAEAALRCGCLLTQCECFDEAQTTLMLGLQALRKSSEFEFAQGQDLLRKLQAALAALNKARELHTKGLARVLWEEATSAYFHGKYPEAKNNCERLRALPAVPAWISEGLDGLELALRWREAKGPKEKWVLHEDFKRLLLSNPSGTFRGYLALLEGDWLLMSQFRLKEASALFFAVETPLRSGMETLNQPGWCESAEALWMRIGFCYYMDRKFQEAAQAFSSGLAFRPERDKTAAGIPSGFQNLMELCRQRRVATPEALLVNGTDRGRILTAMADAYFVADRYGEAKQIYERFRCDPDFKSEYIDHRAHAQFMEARCLYQELETPKALLLLADFAGPYRLAPEAPAALYRFAVFMNTHEQIDPRNAKSYEHFLTSESTRGMALEEKLVDANMTKVGRSKLKKYPRELVDRDVIDVFLYIRRAFPGTEEARMAVVQLGAMCKWQGKFKTALRYFEEAKRLLVSDPRWVKYLDESCIAPLLSQLEKEKKP